MSLPFKLCYILKFITKNSLPNNVNDFKILNKINTNTKIDFTLVYKYFLVLDI